MAFRLPVSGLSLSLGRLTFDRFFCSCGVAGGVANEGVVEEVEMEVLGRAGGAVEVRRTFILVADASPSWRGVF